MVFAALVCWHGRPCSLLFIDKLLSQTGDLGASLSQGCQLAQYIFQLGRKSQPLTVPRASLEGSESVWTSFLWLLCKDTTKDPLWCDHHMCAMLWMNASQTKPYSKPLQQQFLQNGINWPNSYFPAESVPTPFPFPHLCSLLHTLVINLVLGMWLSESLCKWMQLIHSEKPRFLFLGYQKLPKTGLTGGRRPWEGTEENRDGAQEIVGAVSECKKRAQDSCLFLGQEWAIRPAQKIMTLTLIYP